MYGDPDKFGKQVGGDILSNKKTYLLIKAKELARGEIQTELNYWLNETGKPEEKVKAVTDIYNQLNIRRLAEEAMQSYAETALAKLEAIQVAPERKEALKSFAEQLLVREH